MKILVTGANGFVGRHLCRYLQDTGYQLVTPTRSEQKYLPGNIIIGDIASDVPWDELLTDVEIIIHLAARVHVMNERRKNPLSEFRRVNLFATQHLAQAAARQGVKQFIYLSSIKVNGEKTFETPFTEKDLPHPEDDYATSKYEAEQFLQKLAEVTDLSVTIIRPPLIYGPASKGNMQRLISLVHRQIPLPVGSITNSRSLVSIFNLQNLIGACIGNEHAMNQIFLVSDGKDLSTPELIKEISSALNVPYRIFHAPIRALKFVATIFGKKKEIDKLADSLQVNITKLKTQINWRPPFTVSDSIKKTLK